VYISIYLFLRIPPKWFIFGITLFDLARKKTKFFLGIMKLTKGKWQNHGQTMGEGGTCPNNVLPSFLREVVVWGPSSSLGQNISETFAGNL
jgi:hypothetical protein